MLFLRLHRFTFSSFLLITNRSPFEFITLVVARLPFTNCRCSVFVGIKHNLSFYILEGDLPLFLRLFFYASMRSVLSQQTPGYWTLHRLMSAMLRQTGIHCPRVWSTNVCSWLIDQTSPPQIIYVQNQLIFSVFVSCFVWMFLQIYNVIPLHSSRCLKWCHSIAVTWGFGTLSYFVVTQFFLSLFATNVLLCASQPSKIRHAIFFGRG